MSHYDWLDKNIPEFFHKVGVDFSHCPGIVAAHGDKCYSYASQWTDAGIPFNHGVAIYLLSYCRPYSIEVRDTEDGWIAPHQWVIDNYRRFKSLLSN